MSRISVENLSFYYDGSRELIFDKVSFAMDTDWKLGFTGRNGRGKTTFLNLLMGKYEYEGTISSPVSFDYFPMDIPGPSRNTLDLLGDICPGLENWEIIRELNLLEIPEDALYRPLETLSGGERTKALLAALFLKQNNFLLIDEPTNHLDLSAREIVSEYLSRKKGFILVSHDRKFLDGCVDHILSINRADIEVEQGSFSQWLQNKAWRDSFELRENERLKKDIGRLETAVRRSAGWSDKTEKSKIGEHAADRGFIGHKAAKMMKRAKATEVRKENAVKEKSKLLKNLEKADSLAISPLKYHSRRMCEFNGVSVSYGEREIVGGVSFTVEQGDRISLIGRNGSGKSSILKLIAGEKIPFSGGVRVGSGLKISYVPQDASNLCGSLSDYAEQCGIDESLHKAILRKLDFPRPQLEKPMEDFSWGQKKKVLIAKSLCEKAHLYIWDEPLNYIDLISRMQIEELLRKFAPTMLFVEHDAAFVDEIATKVVRL